MERLNLLSLVIPAFGAFAKECMQNGPKDAQGYARRCHKEIVGIGSLIYSLGEECRMGLDTSVLDNLLQALAGRIHKPKFSRSKMRVIPRWKVCHLF
jgi:hypothetical protein